MLIFASELKKLEGARVPSFIYQLNFPAMTAVEKRARELVEEKIADKPELFLIDVTMHSNGKLLILMDGDNGIGIDDCVAISRHVGFHLETENTIEQAYNLEVSSPGIDTPLTLSRQYVKNVGRNLSVKMADGSKREGKLNGLTEDAILIEENIKKKGKKAELIEAVIPFKDITETKVLISFK